MSRLAGSTRLVEPHQRGPRAKGVQGPKQRQPQWRHQRQTQRGKKERRMAPLRVPIGQMQQRYQFFLFLKSCILISFCVADVPSLNSPQRRDVSLPVVPMEPRREHERLPKKHRRRTPESAMCIQSTLHTSVLSKNGSIINGQIAKPFWRNRWITSQCVVRAPLHGASLIVSRKSPEWGLQRQQRPAHCCKRHKCSVIGLDIQGS